MIIAMLDPNGKVISVRDCKTPLEFMPQNFDLRTGERLPSTRRILKGCEGKSHEFIIDHMRAKHDNGNGTVEMEHDRQA